MLCISVCANKTCQSHDTDAYIDNIAFDENWYLHTFVLRLLKPLCDFPNQALYSINNSFTYPTFKLAIHESFNRNRWS